MKDLKTVFVVKVLIITDQSTLATSEVYGKDEYKTYPTDEQILFEMTRWSVAYNVVSAKVEKLYRLVK